MTTTNAQGEYSLAGFVPTPGIDYLVTIWKPGHKPALSFATTKPRNRDSSAWSGRGSYALEVTQPLIKLTSAYKSRRALKMRAIVRTTAVPRSEVQRPGIVRSKAAERTKFAYVNTLISRTKNALIDFRFEATGSTSLGVGVKYSGDINYDVSLTRDLASTSGIPFKKWVGGKGMRYLRTKVYYVKWRYVETWYECPIRIGCTKHQRTWSVVSPEGWNGGEDAKTFSIAPRIRNRAWCGGPITKGNKNYVMRGNAITYREGVEVFGLSLSSQTGYSTSEWTYFKAKRGPIKICGLKGPALSNPGFPIAITAR